MELPGGKGFNLVLRSVVIIVKGMDGGHSMDIEQTPWTECMDEAADWLSLNPESEQTQEVVAREIAAMADAAEEID